MICYEKFKHFLPDCFVLFLVDNSCKKESRGKDERLLSSKREGFEINTRIIQRMAERSGDTASFAYEEGIFFTSILLYD